MAAERFFDAPMLDEMRRVLPLAEELCGDHFRLTAFNLRNAPYDVVTARQLVREGIQPPPQRSQLAELRRMDMTREERSARDRRRTHYRVCLWDPHILAAVEQEGAELGALLLFVLTHELVHVVRFAKRLALFEASDAPREREERAVHETTEKILKKAREPGLDDLLAHLPHLGSCLRALER